MYRIVVKNKNGELVVDEISQHTFSGPGLDLAKSRAKVWAKACYNHAGMMSAKVVVQQKSDWAEVFDAYKAVQQEDNHGWESWLH
ncbi:hypothetical protein [uncultured Mediterranean phage]|nr:hypothetical protein [uncultured Mediterranean phage]